MSFRFKAKTSAVAAVAAAGMLVLAGTLFAPAQAAGTKWVLGYTDGTLASTGNVITTSGATLSFAGTYNSAGATITCSASSPGFSYTVPATPPSGLPGGFIDVLLTVPASLPSGSCTNSVDGGAVNVSFVSGTQWTLRIGALPSGTGYAIGQPYLGTLNGSITVPDGDPTGAGNGTMIATAKTLVGDSGTPPCTITGPAYADVTVSGSYSPSTGVATKTGANVPFRINNGTNAQFGPTSGLPASTAGVANCNRVAQVASLTSASVTLVGPSGKIPTAVWQ